MLRHVPEIVAASTVEVIAGVVVAAAAVAAFVWGVFVWRVDRHQKKVDATEAAERVEREAAEHEAQQRTQLKVVLAAGHRDDWEIQRNRVGDVGTTHLIPGPFISVTLSNPTDRPARIKSLTFVGAASGQERDWGMYFPETIEPRDGFESDVNPFWLQTQFPGDSEIVVKLLTWDGETFISVPESFR